jgi:3-dehydroquinate synthase
VRVPLGDAAYEVLLGDGLLAHLPELLARHCPASHYAIVTDSTVAPLYGEPAGAAIGGVSKVSVIAFPAGEWNKTRETWANITDRLVAAGVGRDGAVVALGGGVVGDIAGFVAATYLRGIPWVQVPTTLLAMIDSSIGGKTGVDTAAGKNLVGAFHQPKLVVADVATLATLPRNHLAAGMAEALKHGAIADREYFDRLRQLASRVLRGDRAALHEVVEGSVTIKAAVVADDERELGRRAVLNFGHTMAHALETVSGYELLHGEAVAIGMALEAALGAALGITEHQAARAVSDALVTYQLPTQRPHSAAADRLLEVIQRDKKSRDRSVRFALLETVGKMHRDAGGAWTAAVPESAIRTLLST